MDLKTPCIIALTAEGAGLAAALSKALSKRLPAHQPVKWHGLASRTEGADTSFDHATDHIRDVFLAGHPIIGICAAGILIRSLSGHLYSKWSDAPVIAVSEDGQVIMPLLGGHHGMTLSDGLGGHDLAKMIAEITGGVAAITTAGDRRFGIALDAPPAPFVMGSDGKAAKRVMARLLAEADKGATIRIMDDLDGHPALQGPNMQGLAQAWRDWLTPLDHLKDEDGDIRITLTLKPAEDVDADLVFHPKIGHLGLGASRYCPSDEMARLIAKGLEEAKLAKEVIRGVYSVDLKADEAAILDAADHVGTRLQVFTAARLDEEKARLQHPSAVVFKEVGCHGVSEGSALAAAGPDGVLVLPKRIDAHATMAIAIDPTGAYQPKDCRHSGRVMLVGIGPGQSEWRTPEATAMIASADELVGYSLYIDILGVLADRKPRRDFALGEEEARCRYALEAAGKGRDVAIICSGDAGIYAMGALVFELLGRESSNGGVSDAAKRAIVETAPGISALQGAAARTGAILGHDFCTISLSDLLTPWETIKARIEAAGMGDFVIAFYNPVSKRRRVGLANARDILLKYRPPSTPVLLASSLGRAEEEIKHRDLGSLDVDEVDMLTVVMIGASTSKRISHQGSRHSGGEVVYTPRGYAKKIDAPNSSSEDMS